MKKTVTLILCLALMIGMNSCGINHSWVVNQNQNSTQVQLKEQNFKVVGEVSGEAQVGYVLLFGGAKKRAMYQEAYRELVSQANLEGTSKALINVTSEEHLGGIPPFYYKRTLILRANVVEFTQ